MNLTTYALTIYLMRAYVIIMKCDESRNAEVSKRLLRGHQMIEDGITPMRVGHDKFEIPSQTNGNKYLVSLRDGRWHCTCPDHEYRHAVCKHIYAVNLWQKISSKLHEDHKKQAIVPISDTFGCKFCGSLQVTKYGKRNGKQNYMCKICGRKFVLNKGFEGMWYDARIVATTLDLYFKGISLRKISDHLKQFYALEVNFSTVYRWIVKYTDVIEAYVETLEPEVGNIWHADEMKVKVKGQWKWLWNMMDEKTRFQLVSMIAETREAQDAKTTFKKAKEVTNTKPRLVVTDGLQGHHSAFNSEFWDQHRRTKHIANVALQSGLNNSIERMHGSIREREKVMRGIKSIETPFIKGNRIYLDFVRPHQALEGRTPAEAAGMGVRGENRWLELLNMSIRSGKLNI
jgi:putative transposase